jgi:HK97 family phage prohead protease
MLKREFFPTVRARIATRAKEGKPGIEGYAAVFNKLSEDLGYFREKIMPGAFADCLKTDPDVRALINHNADLVLGRTKAGTLRLTEDDNGLHFDCDTPDTQAARDLLTSIKRGDVDQCSFGFFVRKQKWSEEEDERGDPMIVRELHAVELFDVSAVTFPAYTQTSVDLRNLWPDGRPRSLRVVPFLLSNDDARANERGCECDCTDCQDGNCGGCTDVACDDADCAEANCPNQEHEPEENAAPPATETRADFLTERERLELRARLAAL